MQNSFFSTMARYKRFLALIGVVFGIALFYYAVRDYISVAHLQKNGHYFVSFIEHHYVASVVLYIVFFACMIAASLPLVGPLAIAGGYLFGLGFGFLYSLFAASLGSAIAFLVLRYFISGASLEQKREKFAKMESKIKKHGVSYLLILQLLSVVPFFVINTVAILAQVSVFTIIWTTLVGGAPTIFLYTFAGRQLRTIGSFGDIFSPRMLVLLILFVLIIFCLPRLVKKYKK